MAMLFSLFKRVATLAFLAVIVTSLFVATVLRESFPGFLHIPGPSSLDAHNPPVQKVKSTIRIPCMGPSGTYVHHSVDDEIQAAALNLCRFDQLSSVHLVNQVQMELSLPRTSRRLI